MCSLKTINYRGGVVRFRIPAHWQEEYEDVGGGTFYAPGGDTGTLRLNVLTMEGPAGKAVNSETAAEVLEGESQKYGAPIMPLGEGVVMIRYDLPAEERGQPLTMRHWRVAQSLGPNNVRLALFSYTLLAEQWDDASSQEELAMIDREIAAAELAPVFSQVSAAKKPWWRPW
jgi:hypothetical protein